MAKRQTTEAATKAAAEKEPVHLTQRQARDILGNIPHIQYVELYRIEWAGQNQMRQQGKAGAVPVEDWREGTRFRCLIMMAEGYKSGPGKGCGDSEAVSMYAAIKASLIRCGLKVPAEMVLP